VLLRLLAVTLERGLGRRLLDLRLLLVLLEVGVLGLVDQRAGQLVGGRDLAAGAEQEAVHAGSHHLSAPLGALVVEHADGGSIGPRIRAGQRLGGPAVLRGDAIASKQLATCCKRIENV